MTNMLLALETSATATSVALSMPDGTLISRHEVAARQQTKLIVPFIDAVLADADATINDVNAVAFGAGPGSFTGLRVATSVAQGLSLAHGMPLVPVSSMAALAQAVATSSKSEVVLVCLDARMEEVYWGTYGLGSEVVTSLSEESVSAPEQIPVPTAPFHAVGPGFESQLQPKLEYLVSKASEFTPGGIPHAREIAFLAQRAYSKGQTVSADAARPTYLRNQVVHRG